MLRSSTVFQADRSDVLWYCKASCKPLVSSKQVRSAVRGQVLWVDAYNDRAATLRHDITLDRVRARRALLRLAPEPLQLRCYSNKASLPLRQWHLSLCDSNGSCITAG